MLEAMQEGIPVLASDIAPHRQLLEPDRGLLFMTNSIEACSEQLEWAIAHPEAMIEMAQKAQQHVRQHYTWHNVVQEHLNLVASLSASDSRKRTASACVRS